ncbi:HAMP domain-containing sensor histidine kinase [Sphingomonas sp.]|uniref:sensor histidine kinase n=1 Tax=Sphingomonas sp. TaxID=28214 RepID=UPI0025FD27F4|nr:HAMP domain-containing sensor histidine kinase [Sphingomonas sp.]
MVRSIRNTLIFGGLGALIVLLAVALAASTGLRRANQVLARSGYSQDQLALAMGLEAGVNTYVARAAMGIPMRARLEEREKIEALLLRYDASIRAERALLTTTGDAVDDADEELATVSELGRLFRAIRRDADTGVATERASLSADLDRFQSLVRRTVAQERAEVTETVGRFDQARRVIRAMAIALPIFTAFVGALGLGLLLARLRRPIARLQSAMAAVSKGHAEPVGDLGFAEFQALAVGFDRMADEIAAQRAALSNVNARLEHDVAARTAELEARNAQLAEIEATRRAFFAQISHELRTPITALQCEAEVALRGRSGDAAMLREALEQIMAQGGVIRRRLADLLAISQAEDGRLVMAQASFDLGQALRESMALADPFARASGSRVEARIDDGECIVRGDAGWMQQALIALLDNAIKFSADAAIRVDLARAAGKAELTIVDNGPGVAEGALERLFERFHQEPAGRARGGSGLGLSVARSVVDHHGGSIAASNRDGGGLRISITLPLAS